MTLRTAELGREKCLHQLPGKGRSHDESPEAHHIQIIVLDALMRRKGLMDKAGTNSDDFVRGNGRTYATAANAHSALHIAAGNGAGERHDEIRIIVVLVRLPITEINYLVTGLTHLSGQELLQLVPAVVGGNAEDHARGWFDGNKVRHIPFACFLDGALYLPATSAVSASLNAHGGTW